MKLPLLVGASVIFAWFQAEAASATTLNISPSWNLVGDSASAPLSVPISFGDAAKVTSVWKWEASKSNWAFYTPAQADGGKVYAASKGYDFLTTINPGEGFWVNASASFAVPLAGSAYSTFMFQDRASGIRPLSAGWNLISVGDGPTPSAFNKAIGATPPTPGSIPNNLVTLWAWDNATSNWYFYAPSLEANNGLSAYISQKKYLDFGTMPIDPSMGFWVNRATTPTSTNVASSIASAKTLFTSLRTNINLLGNPAKTGLLDTQLSAVKTDLSNVKNTFSASRQMVGAMLFGLKLLHSNFPSIPIPFYSRGASCSVAAPGRVICSWGNQNSYNWTGTGNTSINSQHQTIIQPGTTAGSYTWDDIIQTTTYTFSYATFTSNSTTMNSPSQTGNLNATWDASGNLSTFSASGNVAPLYASASLATDHSNVSLNSSTASDSSGNSVVSPSGSVSNVDANNTTLISLGINSGSSIVDQPATASSQAQPISGTLQGSATTRNFKFDGTLTISQFMADKSGRLSPSKASFTGSVTALNTATVNGASNATVGKFMTGTLNYTADPTGLDPTQPKSAANYRKKSFAFQGQVINNTVSPVMTYLVALNDDETVYGIRTVNLTYTDPSNNVVSVKGTMTPAIPGSYSYNTTTGMFIWNPGVPGSKALKATLGTISVDSTTNQVTDGTNSIGIIQGKTVYYSDGTFSSLM